MAFPVLEVISLLTQLKSHKSILSTAGSSVYLSMAKGTEALSDEDIGDEPWRACPGCRRGILATDPQHSRVLGICKRLGVHRVTDSQSGLLTGTDDSPPVPDLRVGQTKDWTTLDIRSSIRALRNQHRHTRQREQSELHLRCCHADAASIRRLPSAAGVGGDVLNDIPDLIKRSLRLGRLGAL